MRKTAAWKFSSASVCAEIRRQSDRMGAWLRLFGLHLMEISRTGWGMLQMPGYAAITRSREMRVDPELIAATAR